MHFIPLKEHIIYKKKIVYMGSKNVRNQILMERKKGKKVSSLRFYHEYGRDEMLDSKGRSCVQMLIPSYQLIGSAMADTSEYGKKVDKCLEKID